MTTLEYQPAKKKRGKLRGLLLYLALVAALAAGFNRINWQGAISRLQRLRYQWECAHYSAVSGQVVYQELAPGTKVVPDRRFHDVFGDRGTCRIAVAPECWVQVHAQLFKGASLLDDDPVLFLGSLRTKSGPKRMVSVLRSTNPSGETFMDEGEVGDVVTLAGFGEGMTDKCTEVKMQNSRIGKIRQWCSRFTIFAGQADPADPSHFTIRYQADENEGIIDGWLHDDDTVVLRVRTGPGFQTPIDANRERLLKNN